MAGRQAEVVPRCVYTRLCPPDRLRRTGCSCLETSRCPFVSVDRRSSQNSCICRHNRNRKHRSCRRLAAPEAGTRPLLLRQLFGRNSTSALVGRNICGGQILVIIQRRRVSELQSFRCLYLRKYAASFIEILQISLKFIALISINY